MTTWDAFLYWDERAVLDVRRAELVPLDVTHVAIVGRTTFAGQPHPIPDLDIPVWVVPDPPDRMPPFERERLQRVRAAAALASFGATAEDTVIFGDVDEIPTVGAIDRRGPELTAIRMPYHQLLATWRLPLERDRWHRQHPVVGLYADLCRTGFAQARETSHDMPFVTGGWHLSSMGGRLALAKFGAYAHHGDAWRDGLDFDRLRRYAYEGKDVAGRFTMDPCPLDELPYAMRHDPDRYREFFDPDLW